RADPRPRSARGRGAPDRSRELARRARQHHRHRRRSPMTVERWARDLIASESLAGKLAPPPVPSEWERAPSPLRIDAPGRPPELRVIDKHERTPRRGALVDPKRRAQLLHTFF